MDVVDLTLDSDEESSPDPKRPRLQPVESSDSEPTKISGEGSLPVSQAGPSSPSPTVSGSAFKHRRSGFSTSWLQTYPWLVKSERGMLCSLCKRHNCYPQNGSETWNSRPCQTLREDSIKRHLASDMHKTAIQQEREALKAKEYGGIKQYFSKQVSANREAVQAGMQIVYWHAESEVAHFTKFESLKHLCIDLGASVLKDLDRGKNAKYSSNRIIDEWLHILANVVREDVKQELDNSLCIGLMCDESTDISINKELIIFARVVLPNCGVHYRYLQTVELADGRAETIEKALLPCLDNYGLRMDKVSGFGSDGASVMVGRKTGVATRLKRNNPSMLSIHCINHRLALGASQSIDTVKYLHKFNEILVGIFKFYHYSSVRQHALKEIQAICNDPVLKFKEPKSVRWLSHRKAVEAIRRSLQSLIISLEREASERG